MNCEPADSFLLSCAATGPLELEILERGQSQGYRRTFAQPCLLIGSDDRNDLCIKGSGMRPHHAYLQVIGGQVFCVKLAKDRRKRREQRAHQFGWLFPGKSVRINGLSLRLVPDPGLPQRFPEVLPNPLKRVGSASELARQAVYLEFMGSAKKPILWRMSRMLTLVGRAPACKIRLADERCADFQCALLYTPRGVWIVDLLGLGGVLLDGKPLRWALIQHGNRFQIGSFSLALQHQSTGGSVFDLEAVDSQQDLPTFTRKLSTSSVLPPTALLPWPEREQYAELAIAAMRAGSVALHTALSHSVAQQLDHLKQELLDQFQTVMAGIAQALFAHHQERMRLVQQELDQVHQLTKELQKLREDMQAQLHPSPEVDGVGNKAIATLSTAAARLPADSGPADQEAGSGIAGSFTPAGGSGANHAMTQPPGGAASTESNGGDLQVQILERLVALHRRRQGRLRRILNLITGE
jgi:hypothetical protein